MSDASLIKKVEHILSYEDEREPDELENSAKYIISLIRKHDKRVAYRVASKKKRPAPILHPATIRR